MELIRGARDLIDSRANFQRLSDARIVRGWIVAVEDNFVAVRACDDAPLRAGERFAARTARLDGDVAFIAVLADAAPISAEDAFQKASQGDRATMLDYGDRTYVFQILSVPVPMPSSDDPRFACEPYPVIVGGGDAEMRDVSPEGLGVVSSRRYYPGEIVSVEVEIRRREVVIEAEVKHCRQVSMDPGLYRIGLKVQNLDRIRRAQWLSVVKERSQPRTRSWALEEPSASVEPVPIPRPEETGIPWACLTPAPDLAADPAETPPIDLWEGRYPRD